jgi:hypothetical protein
MSTAMQRIGESIVGSNKKYSKQPSMRSNYNQKLDESKFSHDSFNERFKTREQKDFINQANKIIRERIKNK